VKKIVFAAALLMIGAFAQAATHGADGVTVHVRHGCRSASCVSVYVPGHGYYRVGHRPQVGKVHKDTTRFASSVKADDAATAVPAAAPMEPAKTPDVNALPAATNAAPAK
jgi:hypothetical protein